MKQKINCYIRSAVAEMKEKKQKLNGEKPTFKNLANQMGIEYQTLIKYLDGLIDPPVSRALKASQLLNRSIEDLWEEI